MLSMETKQYVDKPLKITKNSRVITDLIFLNKKIEVYMIHELKITDRG